MITQEQILKHAIKFRDDSNAPKSYEVGFFHGATWMQEQDQWMPGIPEDYRTYMFMITFHEYGKPASQMLIGSISEETEELLDHDGQPTGWDKAHEVITHYRLPPNPPKTTS